jgi:DNA-binding PadR family transcriptional regulator
MITSSASASVRTKPTEPYLTIGNRILITLLKSSRLADIRKELVLSVKDITQDTLQKNLDILVKEGLVEVEMKKGKGMCIYTLTEKGRVHALSLLFALGMQDQDLREFIDMLPKLTLRRAIQLLADIWTFYKRRNGDDDNDASEMLKTIERLQNEAEDLYDYYTDTRLAVFSSITDEQLREGNSVIYGDLLINLPFKDRIYLLELFIKVMDTYYGLSRKERRFFRDTLKVLKDTCSVLYSDDTKNKDNTKGRDTNQVQMC